MSVENEEHPRPPREKRTFSIDNIIGNSMQMENSKEARLPATPQRTPKKQSEKSRENSGKNRIILWKLFISVSMILIWSVVLVPLVLSGLRKVLVIPHNITVNEELLIKLNLTNETVICPGNYIFSPVVKSCQPICGHWSSCGELCYLIERAVFAIFAIVGIAASLVALISWIRLSSTWKFQHHPILIGILVNLFQSIGTGLYDIPGVYYFVCGGRDIDHDSLEKKANIHIQILGAIIHSLALSNRFWFVIALTYILLKVSFPLRDFFNTKRKRITLIIIELCICFGIPLITEVISFASGARYRLSPKASVLASDNPLFTAAFGYIPHALITSFTMSIIMLIIYNIRSKLIGNNTSIQGIEKRLLYFSALYFVLAVIIAVSVSIHIVIDSHLEAQVDKYRATITLNSFLRTPDNPFTNNTVSDLLSREDKLRITEATRPILIYLSGGTQRLMFMVVFAVTNINVFTLAKFKALFKLKINSTSVFGNNNRS